MRERSTVFGNRPATCRLRKKIDDFPLEISRGSRYYSVTVDYATCINFYHFSTYAYISE